MTSPLLKFGLPGACLAGLVGLVVLVTTCGRQPSGSDTTFSHATIGSTACSQCHEPIRPAAFPEAAGLAAYPHGNNQDCGDCHVPKDVTSSGGDSPDPSLWLPRRTEDHDSLKPTKCEPCHFNERPTTSADPKHPTSGDCVSCHNGQWTGSFHG